MSTFSRDAFFQLDEQINKLNRLRQIVKHIRQYYSLHPNFAKDAYGNVENYLKQHISNQDWTLLNQLHVPMHHKAVLYIA